MTCHLYLLRLDFTTLASWNTNGLNEIEYFFHVKFRGVQCRVDKTALIHGVPTAQGLSLIPAHQVTFMCVCPCRQVQTSHLCSRKQKGGRDEAQQQVCLSSRIRSIREAVRGSFHLHSINQNIIISIWPPQTTREAGKCSFDVLNHLPSKKMEVCIFGNLSQLPWSKGRTHIGGQSTAFVTSHFGSKVLVWVV